MTEVVVAMGAGHGHDPTILQHLAGQLRARHIGRPRSSTLDDGVPRVMTLPTTPMSGAGSSCPPRIP